MGAEGRIAFEPSGKGRCHQKIGGDRLQQLAVRWAERGVGLVERALRLTTLPQGSRDRGVLRPVIRIKRDLGLISKRPQEAFGLVKHIREPFFCVGHTCLRFQPG